MNLNKYLRQKQPTVVKTPVLSVSPSLSGNPLSIVENWHKSVEN
jgi:hypothetical protein